MDNKKELHVSSPIFDRNDFKLDTFMLIYKDKLSEIDIKTFNFLRGNYEDFRIDSLDQAIPLKNTGEPEFIDSSIIYTFSFGRLSSNRNKFILKV